jgi:BirA family biotin operon repressor/biotin-[acetyl-CoA-carboxylase] ligase
MLKEKGFETKIKWPNDLLIQKRKVAGVICETFPLNERTGVILSIGLNVNMSKDFLRLIDQPATSLAEVSKRSWDLQEILSSLSEHFVQNLEKLKREGFAPFQAPFEQILAYKGEAISFLSGNQMLQGICQGITREGYLELILPSGEKKLLAAGEIGPENYT